MSPPIPTSGWWRELRGGFDHASERHPALVVLSLGGAGYGYYGRPVDAPASPLVGLLGLLALIGLVALIVLLWTGYRFDVNVTPP